MKEGYKLTELGEIPIDWHFKYFKDVMTGFSSGQTPSRAIPEYYKGDIRWITSGELNYNVITDTIEKITPQAVRRTNLKILPKGTFLIAITGLEAEGTRGSCGIVGEEATTNQSCMALYPKKELCNDYLRHFYVKFGNWLAFKYCQGTKQQSYTGKIAKILPIILPPTKEEQIAIANALSDIDKLIISLQNIIEKKKQISAGAISQMLTPNTSWSCKKLAKLMEFANGKPFESLLREDGNYSLITLDSIDIKGKLKPSHRKVSINDNSLKKGDIVTVLSDIAHGKLLGLCDIIPADNQYVLNQRMGRLRFAKEINPVFARYSLNKNQEYFRMCGQGSSQKHIYKKDFNNMDFYYPSYVEQTTIGIILSGMEAEINALNKNLYKYTQVKQGMMHDLLTGKKRLITQHG